MTASRDPEDHEECKQKYIGKLYTVTFHHTKNNIYLLKPECGFKDVKWSFYLAISPIKKIFNRKMGKQGGK